MYLVGGAADDELPAVAAVLGEAFQDDPVVVGMVGRGAGRRERATHLYAALLRAEGADAVVVDVARDDEGAVVGAAVWERPGTCGPSLPTLLREMPTFLRALGVAGVPRALRGLSAFSHSRPAGPHWYLGEIGVATAARGAGVGSRLLAHRLRHVDATGVGAYLESSTTRNRALYARHGFVERGEIRGVPGAHPVAMWREPRPTLPR